MGWITMENRCAAIDVGTNTVKLTIVEKESRNAFIPLVDTAVTTRLGEGIHAKRLRETAIRRTINCLQDYIALCRAHHVERVAAVGTSALRDAVNRDEFLERAAELGLNVKVISGEEEARLSFLAVSRDPLWRSADRVVVVDIGGGSSELILGEPRLGDIQERISFQIGAVRLTETCIRSDPPSIRDMAESNAAVSEAMKGFSLPDSSMIAVGVGGTFVNMAAVKEGMEQKNPERLHGVRLTSLDVEAQITLYASKTIEERKRITGLDPARADIILGGAIILSQILSHCGQDSIHCSTRGLRWGVLYDAFR